MCFYNRYDGWWAEVYYKAQKVGPHTCDECNRHLDGVYHHTFAQQYEECSRCSRRDDWGEDDADLECHCEEPDYGETSEYTCCHECHLFLSAIEAVEKDAGCSSITQRPMPTRMVEQLQDQGSAELDRYFQKASETHPEMTGGYLKWIQEKIEQ